jgi:hypothetical protein
MTTRPIRTTPMMHLNSPRPTPGNTDPLNHILPRPSMYPITHPNPITTRPTVPPLMPFHTHPIRGTVKPGPSSVSRWHHRHPSQRHPSRLLPVDRNPRLHPHPRPLLSAYMLLLPRSPNPPTPRYGELLLERPRAQTHLPNPSGNRGRKKLPPLGIPHRWRQLRWILISERHALSFIPTCQLMMLMITCACLCARGTL